MKKVIITGATGFIGKAFTKYLLDNGVYVYAIVRNVQKLDVVHKNLKIVEASADKYSCLTKLINDEIDVFYHFAWAGAYGDETSDYNLQIDNIKYSMDALSEAVKLKCRKFVFIGTIAEVEVVDHIAANVCSPRAVCVYATAKLAAEMMAKTICAKNNIMFNGTLLANVFGPGDYSERSTNFILKKFLRNEAPKLVEGLAPNDWLYIKDAVRLIEAVGEKGHNMKTYYIGHNEVRPLRDIISQAKNAVNPDIELKFGELKDSFITNYSLTNVGELFVDTGIKAEYDFETSIKEHCDWLKSTSKGQ